MPAPRADTPLTPDQIKQATDELANERDHLSATTQQGSGPGKPAASGKAAEARKKPASAAAPPAAQAAASSAGHAAGAEAKP